MKHFVRDPLVIMGALAGVIGVSHAIDVSFLNTDAEAVMWMTSVIVAWIAALTPWIRRSHAWAIMTVMPTLTATSYAIDGWWHGDTTAQFRTAFWCLAVWGIMNAALQSGGE